MFDEEKEELQEEEEQQEEEQYEEEGEEEQEKPERKYYRSQEEVDAAVQRRLDREKRKTARELGMTMEEAKEYIEAGKSVSQAAGMTPSQVRQRLIQQQQQRGQQMQQQGNYQQPAPPVDDEVRREIRELKETLTEKDKADMFQNEETKARKEFGSLYDEYAEDIREKAEDLDISPVDAAAMVLRPKLKDHYESQTKKKQQAKKKRKVEGSGEGPSKGEDPETILTDAQKNTARRMRIPLEKYYNRLKEIGEIE